MPGRAAGKPAQAMLSNDTWAGPVGPSLNTHPVNYERNFHVSCFPGGDQADLPSPVHEAALPDVAAAGVGASSRLRRSPAPRTSCSTLRRSVEKHPWQDCAEGRPWYLLARRATLARAGRSLTKHAHTRIECLEYRT